MGKGIKIFTIIWGMIALIWLALGLYQLRYEIGLALFTELFLPVLGGLFAIWILVYSISIKSLKFFLTWVIILAVGWISLWLILD